MRITEIHHSSLPDQISKVNLPPAVIGRLFAESIEDPVGLLLLTDLVMAKDQFVCVRSGDGIPPPVHKFVVEQKSFNLDTGLE